MVGVAGGATRSTIVNHQVNFEGKKLWEFLQQPSFLGKTKQSGGCRSEGWLSGNTREYGSSADFSVPLASSQWKAWNHLDAFYGIFFF